GQVSVFDAGRGPCYRCLFAEPPPPGLVPGCAEAGVLGVLPGIIGSLQALEAIKLLLGAGTSLVGRLLLFEALPLSFREIELRKDPACPACGERPSITHLIDYDAFCGATANGGSAEDVYPLEVDARLRANPGSVQVVDVREPAEITIVAMPHARLVPLADLAVRMAELDPVTPIVTVCHKGSRSRAAAELLRAAGFSARSLAGGIDAWAREVDPSLARY
ncbi:MAG: ThiF family adenylyltransferase, partial [Gemmatimonadales bacterium]